MTSSNIRTHFHEVTLSIWPEALSLSLEDIRHVVEGKGIVNPDELSPAIERDSELFSEFALEKYRRELLETASHSFFPTGKQKVFLWVRFLSIEPEGMVLQYYLGCTTPNTEMVLNRFWHQDATPLLTLKYKLEAMMKERGVNVASRAMIREALTELDLRSLL